MCHVSMMMQLTHVRAQAGSFSQPKVSIAPEQHVAFSQLTITWGSISAEVEGKSDILLQQCPRRPCLVVALIEVYYTANELIMRNVAVILAPTE